MNEPWWKDNGGMLDREKHARFVVRREEMARDARVPLPCLWEPLPKDLSEGERTWATKYKKHRAKGISGLLATGPSESLDPVIKFGAMAGFLARQPSKTRFEASAPKQ
jgi:hypothetical protein